MPVWLAGIIARLHAKSPGDHFTSAEEVHELLEQCLAHVQQPTAVPLPASCPIVAFRSAQGRLFRRAKNDYERFTRPALLVLTSVVIVSLLVAGSHFFTSENNRREYAAPGHPAAATASNAEANDPDPATAWDAASSDIDIYREDFTPFEMRSQHLWDATPELKQE
jgi:hypothetical protein